VRAAAYNVLIRAYSKRGSAVVALRVFDEMRVAWVERKKIEKERAGAGGTFPMPY
jgi:pentatricopeptide repeat protein